MWGGGQGGCDRRIDVFRKIKKKKNFFFLGGGGWGGGGGGEGSGWGGVDVIEELKFLGKFTKNNLFGGGVGLVGGGQGGCERRNFCENSKKNNFFFWGGGSGGESGWWGGWVRVDVKAMFAVGGDVGYGDVN